ncbi:hypothetical protein GCM10027034_37050 [Ramlibacter solisilvae]|uniref:hypothetical protein n=1 Tax=Ramlibacter tataouinensis TaxID=94132 RepID=UPI0011AE4351|nr:hypothetical protein [Ramlibacter tataouinensis]
MQIPVDLLSPIDRLQQAQIVYGELADSQTIPPDGTVEMVVFHKEGSTPPKASDDPCAPILNTFKCLIFYAAYASPAVMLPFFAISLPYFAAIELSKVPDAKPAPNTENASEAPQMQKRSETESGANSAAKPTDDGSAQAAISIPPLPKERATVLSREQHEKWLASVVMEGGSAWDDAYVSALNQALGWKVPLVNGAVEHREPEQDGKSTSTSSAGNLQAGISRIALLDSKLGEQRLILCARSLIQRDKAATRYFETCQSGTIGLALPHDSPAGSEALRAALVEHARRLAALQAKALTGQTTFVRAAW